MRADSGVEDVEHERPSLLDPGLTVREGPRSLELDEAAQHARAACRVHLRVGAERVAAEDGLLLSSMASGCSREIVSSGAVERAGSVVAAGTLTRVGAMGLRERREGVAAREPGDRAVDGVASSSSASPVRAACSAAFPCQTAGQRCVAAPMPTAPFTRARASYGSRVSIAWAATRPALRVVQPWRPCGSRRTLTS